MKVAVKTRNQANAIIAKSMSSSHRPEENGEFRLVEHLVPRCSVVVDVGANVGAWSEKVLAVNGGRRPFQLHAFEPGHTAFRELEERLGTLENVQLNNMALGEGLGRAELAELDQCSEQSSFVRTELHVGATLIPVQVTTLDTYAEGLDLRSIDFVKIDTEGWDFRVLSGAESLLRGERIRCLQFEYNACWAEAGSTLAGAQRLLEECGFKVFLLRNEGLFEFSYETYGDFFAYSNFVAVHISEIEMIRQLIRGRA